MSSLETLFGVTLIVQALLTGTLRLGYDQALLAEVGGALARAVMHDMRWAVRERHGLRSVEPLHAGGFMVVQRLRGDLGLFVHRAPARLVTDGAFEKEGGAQRFLLASTPTAERMTAVLAQVHKVLAAVDGDDDLDIDPALGACVQLALAGPHRVAPPDAAASPPLTVSALGMHLHAATTVDVAAVVHEQRAADREADRGFAVRREVGGGGDRLPADAAADDVGSRCRRRLRSWERSSSRGSVPPSSLPRGRRSPPTSRSRVSRGYYQVRHVLTCCGCLTRASATAPAAAHGSRRPRRATKIRSRRRSARGTRAGSGDGNRYTRSRRPRRCCRDSLRRGCRGRADA